MISPTTSKLEFVDNVGLLNGTSADASIRTSSLATGSKEATTHDEDIAGRRSKLCTLDIIGHGIRDC